MTLEKYYLYVMVAAACCLFVTGLILALVKAPSDVHNTKYRVMKHTLTVAVLILGALNLVQVMFDDNGVVSYLAPCLSLAVGYLQAMLFTMALMVLIRPSEVTWRTVGIQLGIILAVDTCLIGAFSLLSPHNFIYVYELGIILYLLQLAFYVWWFHRSRKIFISQIRRFYEEEEIERSLWWVNVIFWTALTVGVLSLLMAFNDRTVDMWLTIALVLLYALFAVCVINYGLSAQVILPAIYQETTKQVASSNPTELSKLEIWVREKGYLETTKPVKTIAAEVGMSVEQFQRYFRDVMGEEFRTWRVRRRIDEAKRLMAEHPDYSTSKIGKLSGFNDRSFFYQQFRRITGVSVSTYRNSLQNPF